MLKMIEVSEIVSCVHLDMLKQPVVGHPTLHVMLYVKGMYLYVAVEEGRIKICCPDCFYNATQTLGMFVH